MKKFIKIFFNSYDIIISCPIVVSFSGDISFLSKGNTSNLTQKITLRNYIGYNKKKSDEEIEYIVRDNEKGFIKQNIETKYSINKKLLKKIGLNGKIGFLSKYNSANPPSIIGNILILKLLIDKKLSIEDIEKLDLENKDYKKILKLILDLDKKLLEKYNFFGTNRNNSIYLGATLLTSDSHILSIQNGENYLFYHQNFYI